jgi:hypothetical protein
VLRWNSVISPARVSAPGSPTMIIPATAGQTATSPACQASAGPGGCPPGSANRVKFTGTEPTQLVSPGSSLTPRRLRAANSIDGASLLLRRQRWSIDVVRAGRAATATITVRQRGQPNG